MADGAFCGNGAPDLDSRWEVRLRARVSSGVGGGGAWSPLVFVPHLELRFLGSSRPAAGFTSTRPFMIFYTLQTLSDVLLDCRVSSRSAATRA